MANHDENAATWPDGSPKTPDAVAAEVTGHTYGCNCLRCDEARASSPAAPRKCLTLNCPNEADVVLIVKYADPARTERPYCTPCADERRRMFPDRIRDEVTL